MLDFCFKIRSQTSLKEIIRILKNDGKIDGWKLRDKISDHSSKKSGILAEILGDRLLFIKWVNPEECRESLGMRSGEGDKEHWLQSNFWSVSHLFLKPRILVSLFSLQYLFYS